MALKRNLNDKVIAGVCSGIAKEMDIDPTIVRLLFILALFLTVGLPVLIYIIMWVLTPTE